MVEIEVAAVDDATFRVTVREGASQTSHSVSATREMAERYGGAGDPARLVEESFRFLLEREPKESILSRFELPDIERYFPEYRREIRRRLGES